MRSRDDILFRNIVITHMFVSVSFLTHVVSLNSEDKRTSTYGKHVLYVINNNNLFRGRFQNQCCVRANHSRV